MKFFIVFAVLFQVLYSVTSEDDYFLQNLKHQFSDVPRNVKLFDFLQNENNLKGLLGLHNEMCEQLNHYGQLKNNHRARRNAETTEAPSTVSTDSTTLATDATSSSVAPDATAAPIVANTTVDSSDKASDSTSVTPPSSSAQRKRRDATDASASTTNATLSSNQPDDKDQQQNLNDQQPPVDDQGGDQGTGENQEAAMQAAGVAYFKQLVLSVLRYILGCLMTYINMFY